MGFWDKGGQGAAHRPGLTTSGGFQVDPKHPDSQCKEIYRTMLDTVAPHMSGMNGATINLSQNPAGQPGQSAAYDGSGTGMSTSGSLSL